jgi:hypothetical protein
MYFVWRKDQKSALVAEFIGIVSGATPSPE